MEVVLGSIWIVVISSQVSKTHDLFAFCYTILELQRAKLESTKYMGQNEALFGYVGELIGNLQNMLQTKNWV